MLDAILQIITFVFYLAAGLVALLIVGYIALVIALNIDTLWTKPQRWFENAKPITLSKNGYYNVGQELDLAVFPVVTDFTVQVENTGKTFGNHLRFKSEALGYLASFMDWDFVDRQLAQYQWRDIPTGDTEYPFDVGEQGWQILIFEDNDFVYVLFGYEICCLEFPTWFKVEKNRYYEEWSRIISEFNPNFRPSTQAP